MPHVEKIELRNSQVHTAILDSLYARTQSVKYLN